MKIIITLTKKLSENIYNTTTENLKNSIDFDEKICYYIVKERKHPKISREVGTGTFQIFKKENGPMER